MKALSFQVLFVLWVLCLVTLAGGESQLCLPPLSSPGELPGSGGAGGGGRGVGDTGWGYRHQGTFLGCEGSHSRIGLGLGSGAGSLQQRSGNREV